MSISEFYTRFDYFSQTLQASALSMTNDMDRARELYQETAYRALKKREEIMTGTNTKDRLTKLMTKLAKKNS